MVANETTYDLLKENNVALVLIHFAECAERNWKLGPRKFRSPNVREELPLASGSQQVFQFATMYRFETLCSAMLHAKSRISG